MNSATLSSFINRFPRLSIWLGLYDWYVRLARREDAAIPREPCRICGMPKRVGGKCIYCDYSVDVSKGVVR
jgi:hypothetical protein